MEEKRITATATLVCAKLDKFMRYGRISRFSRLINVLCWVKRFIVKSRKKIQDFPSELSTEEKEKAEKVLWSRTQFESFGDVTNSVKGLNVMKHDQRLLRVKTKLLDSAEEFFFKYPILVPSKNHVVNSVIRDCHFKNCDAGLQTVGFILRENYWIISAIPLSHVRHHQFIYQWTDSGTLKYLKL